MTAIMDALEQPHVQLLLRLVLGGLLLLAGITKLADRAAFREAVAEYEVLPKQLEAFFASTVPILEVALGMLLLAGLGTAFAASLAIPLFLSFGIAIGVNLIRGRNFDCHCLGAVQRDEIGGPALVRSLALAFAALYVAIGASGFGALETAIGGSTQGLPPVAEVIPVVFMAAVVLNVLILLPELIAFRATFANASAGHTAHAGHHAEGTGAS